MVISRPHQSWRGQIAILSDAFKKALNIPVGFDTDVNGSALGEATWGITKGWKTAYISLLEPVSVWVL